MPAWANVAFQILFFVIIFLVVYNQLKVRVLSKLHPNKWVILIIAIIVFFVPTMVTTYYKYNLNGTVWQYIQSAIFIIFFLWFIDLKSGAMYNAPNRGAVNRKNNIVIRPKAKPNRVKDKVSKNNKK